jgi:hypothetical protein
LFSPVRRFRSSLLCVSLLAAAFSPAISLAAEASDTEAILSRLEADRQSKLLATESIAKAKNALERARSALAAGDTRSARLLREVAHQWALVGRDVVRAATAETQADQADRRLHDVETRLVRARALLEETILRRGRAREKLEEVERQTAPGQSARKAAPANETGATTQPSSSKAGAPKTAAPKAPPAKPAAPQGPAQSEKPAAKPPPKPSGAAP